ncbi:MAG: hypothetical protein WD029_01040 [Microthrixaceae bacterium]
MQTTSNLPIDADPPRYRCTACGNLTRFEVTVSRRTRSFHHYTVGGELSIEDQVVLDEDYESVVCRWCGTSASVIEIDAVQVEPEQLAGETLGAESGL